MKTMHFYLKLFWFMMPFFFDLLKERGVAVAYDPTKEYGENYIVNPNLDVAEEVDITKEDDKEEDKSSCSDDKDSDKWTNKYTGVQLGFLVGVCLRGQTSCCSGTLIHKNWVLTASHCIRKSGQMDTSSFGDKMIESPDIVVNQKGGGLPQNLYDQLWNKPLDLKIGQTGRGASNGWRKVKQVIFHSKFEGEALSWKGNDFALLQLDSTAFLVSQRLSVPICLPEMTSAQLADGDYIYTSGYGRRKIPYCLTNEKGPEKFALCGRPKGCHHRSLKCGLEFLYGGQLHDRCLKTPSPSANNPLCKNLRENHPETSSIYEPIYVLNETGNSILTVCYQVNSSHGWCSTREPDKVKNSEPSYTGGWGFCSNMADQDQCTQYIVKTKNDLSAFLVTKFDEKFCVGELALNLKVEQPTASLQGYSLFPKLFCLAQNFTLPPPNNRVYKKDGNVFQKVQITPKVHSLLLEKDELHAIDGGMSCFGDSGGPAFKLVEKPKKNESKYPVPVMVGVFSFMLWGTCRGRHEPSYFGRVVEYLDWIYQYVPKGEVCTHKY